jgi:NitT/TauT family transport system ATP-binding protein
VSAISPLQTVAEEGSSASKISLRGVSKSFVSARGDAVAAVSSITFDVSPGEFVCLIGPSGCGKSTVLHMVAGLERPDEGDVLVDGDRVAIPGPDRVLLFQDPALFPWLSVRRNVELAVELAGMGPEGPGVAAAWLRRVHLSSFAEAQPHELSGGMRQRAALARALAVRPEVMLADEPFGVLDAQSREILQKQLQEIWSETHTTFLFVTNNVREAVFLADRVLVMSARPGTMRSEYRIAAPRPRRLEDPLLANVVASIHDDLMEEVERAVAPDTGRVADLA